MFGQDVTATVAVARPNESRRQHWTDLTQALASIGREWTLQGSWCGGKKKKKKTQNLLIETTHKSLQGAFTMAAVGAMLRLHQKLCKYRKQLCWRNV